LTNPRTELLHEALKVADKNGYNGIYLLATGAGKGRFMIECAKILKPNKILYLCNSTELRDKTFIHELHKWDAAYLIPFIEFQCYQTAYKYVDKTYDLLLADEFDYSLTPEYSRVYANNQFANKILVSATLDPAKRVLAEKIAPIVFEKKQVELIDKGVLNQINYYFVNYNLSFAENKQYLAFNKQFSVMLQQPRSVAREKRLNNLKIYRKQWLSNLSTSAEVTKWILSTLKHKNEKVLIFCGLSKQAERVSPYTYHSKTDVGEKNLRAFESGEIKELAVVEKLTRGANIEGIKHIIYNTIDSSMTKLTQKTGRGLRLPAGEKLNVFFQVPYYTHPFYGRRATVVNDWVTSSTKDMDISGAQHINYQV
jgi:superfamily II DNA or RNA helicase